MRVSFCLHLCRRPALKRAASWCAMYVIFVRSWPKWECPDKLQCISQHWGFMHALLAVLVMENCAQPTNVRIPYSRVLLEKLTGSQLVKKFPTFYGTRRFITAFTSARYLSVSSARSIQSIPPHLPYWRSILILSFHLRLSLPSGLFPSGFPTKPSPPYILHAPPISFFSIFTTGI